MHSLVQTRFLLKEDKNPRLTQKMVTMIFFSYFRKVVLFMPCQEDYLHDQ